MYLSAIGLCRTSDEQKMRSELAWSAVVDNRINQGRDNTPINLYFKRLRNMSDSFLSAVKRDYQAAFLPPSPPPPLPTTAACDSGSAAAERLSPSAVDNSMATITATAPMVPFSMQSAVDPSASVVGTPTPTGGGGQDTESIPLSTALSLLNSDASSVFGSEGSQLDSITLHDADVNTSVGGAAAAVGISANQVAVGENLNVGLRDMSSVVDMMQQNQHLPQQQQQQQQLHQISIKTESSAIPADVKPILHAGGGLLAAVKEEDEEPSPKRPREDESSVAAWQGVDAVIESYRKYKQGKF